MPTLADLKTILINSGQFISVSVIAITLITSCIWVIQQSTPLFYVVPGFYF
ncbi:hypothetical protein MNBD_GAMMA21-2747 [hydrothermal vent metagenome]|uniref:Uncharacterized protein n=1 Tax=hydrothermal vent metagenome TaxID=652676 RepID=A0A3B1A0V3_9ZZZZ